MCVLSRLSRSVVVYAALFVLTSGSSLAIAAPGYADGYFSSTDPAEFFCGSSILSWPESPVTASSEALATVNISIAGFAFSPANPTINVGDTVMWTNNDGATHTSTSTTAVWNSGNLANGQSFSFTFNTPGTFPYRCNIHTSMVGSITVQGTSTPTNTPTNTATNTPTNISTSTNTPTNTPTNAPTPTAFDQSVTYTKNTTKLITLTASDPLGGNNLFFSLVNGPLHGLLTAVSGRVCQAAFCHQDFNYMPDTDYFGSDSFTFKATDGNTSHESNTATVTLTGNPSANNQSVTVTKNITKLITITAVDPLGGNNMSFTIVGNPIHGMLTAAAARICQAAFCHQDFNYAPDTNYVGADSFTFTATDLNTGHVSNTATVSISVVEASTPAPTSTNTPTPTASETFTPALTATNTATSTASNTPTFTPTPPAALCELVEGFNDITNLPGWYRQNNSVGGGSRDWFQGDPTQFPAQSPSPVASPTPTSASYIAADFHSGSGIATISNWLIAPRLLLQNGAQMTFWTRTVDTVQFPDRLQVRMSTTDLNLGVGATNVGSFSTLLLDINPTYTTSGYPSVWTQYTVTITGLSSPVEGFLAFRYFVENGGPSGTRSDYIGIDSFEYRCSPATPTATVTATPTATATNAPTTPTNTATPTPTGTPSISGAITYGNAIGNPVPPRFVKNVSVASTAGSPSVGPVITGTPGTYTLTGFGSGSYTVKPTKPGGTNTAITSNDAARVAQGVSGSVPFVSLNQKFASDASGNGTVSSNDAALIARFAAGLTGTGNVGQWKFFTANLSGPPTAPLPTPPYNDSRTYASVTSNATGEDYIALLIGEASGNYNPSTHPRGTVVGGQMPDVREGESAIGKPITVAVQNVVAAVEKEIVVPVSIEGVMGKEIISYEFDLRYDPAVIQPLEDPVDVAGTVSRGLMVVTNAIEPGLLRVVVYGPVPINENGVLLNLRFTAVGSAGAVSPLTFERIMINEGEPMIVINGELRIEEPSRYRSRF